MRLPEYTKHRYRLLRAALWPVRVVACIFALATMARLLWLADQPNEPTGSTAGDAALAVTVGLLVGINVVICIMGAVFVWYPLPKPERKRR